MCLAGGFESPKRVRTPTNRARKPRQPSSSVSSEQGFDSVFMVFFMGCILSGAMLFFIL